MTFLAQVDGQYGQVEYPYEFFAFENFDLTEKLFVEEQQIVKQLNEIRSTLQARKDNLQVNYILNDSLHCADSLLVHKNSYETTDFPYNFFWICDYIWGIFTKTIWL